MDSTPVPDRTVLWARLRLASILLLFVGAAVALHALLFGVHHFLDAWVYFGGSNHLLNGDNLYDNAGIRLPVKPSPLPFTYPPFAAITFAVLFGGSFTHGILLLTVLGLTGLLVMCLLVARGLNADPQRATVIALAAAGVGMMLEPVRETLSYGQVNLVLAGLVALDCLARAPRWPRGMLIGIAAAIKLTPAAFVIYFIARRQWKEAATAGASFAVCGVLGWIFAPGSSTRYWFDELLNPGRIGSVRFVTNQSLRGAIERTFGHTSLSTVLWLAASLVVVGAALFAAYRFRRVGEDVLAWLAVALAVTLVSPVSWSHHWVWVAGGIAAVGYRAVQRRSWLGVTAVVLATVVFWMGAHWQLYGVPIQNWTLWQHVKEEGYVLVGIGTLALLTLLPRIFVAPHRRDELSTPLLTGSRPGPR